MGSVHVALSTVEPGSVKSGPGRACAAILSLRAISHSASLVWSHTTPTASVAISDSHASIPFHSAVFGFDRGGVCPADDTMAGSGKTSTNPKWERVLRVFYLFWPSWVCGLLDI